jgi:hypothetical protein
VIGAEGQDLEDEQVERALRQIRLRHVDLSELDRSLRPFLSVVNRNTARFNQAATRLRARFNAAWRRGFSPGQGRPEGPPLHSVQRALRAIRAYVSDTSAIILRRAGDHLSRKSSHFCFSSQLLVKLLASDS